MKSTLLVARLPGDSERRLSTCAYADDLTHFESEDGKFTRILPAYEEYASRSGTKINLEKSHRLWVGAWRSRTDRPLGIGWETNFGKYLCRPIRRPRRASWRMTCSKRSRQQSGTGGPGSPPCLSLAGSARSISSSHQRCGIPYKRTRQRRHRVQRTLLDFVWMHSRH
ncbi:hypothetical protein J437_LFUL001810 [Ladona fulva]|uniref:Reverse transcriptase n=1 Tax=Ladona fulva TaxID=123851 RepID=A0A8K0JWT2_LADFU|nr:hypothetical protein J437_LFUL001810 [Ladona fulva]